ncbi:hypothetical protein [Streptomyces griseus]|uniref:hypothetical protein n=1 Tax=Streptomyces griseus TaxID=1911 RepID=UPI00368B2CA3
MRRGVGAVAVDHVGPGLLGGFEPGGVLAGFGQFFPSAGELVRQAGPERPLLRRGLVDLHLEVADLFLVEEAGAFLRVCCGVRAVGELRPVAAAVGFGQVQRMNAVAAVEPCAQSVEREQRAFR